MQQLIQALVMLIELYTAQLLTATHTFAITESTVPQKSMVLSVLRTQVTPSYVLSSFLCVPKKVARTQYNTKTAATKIRIQQFPQDKAGSLPWIYPSLIHRMQTYWSKTNLDRAIFHTLKKNSYWLITTSSTCLVPRYQSLQKLLASQILAQF